MTPDTYLLAAITACAASLVVIELYRLRRDATAVNRGRCAAAPTSGSQPFAPPSPAAPPHGTMDVGGTMTAAELTDALRARFRDLQLAEREEAVRELNGVLREADGSHRGALQIALHTRLGVPFVARGGEGSPVPQQ